jgi:hypothetical protein
LTTRRCFAADIDQFDIGDQRDALLDDDVDGIPVRRRRLRVQRAGDQPQLYATVSELMRAANAS